MERERVEARLLKGFRDIEPPDQIFRQHLLEAIRRVYDSFGYLPLDTPAQEYLEVLAGKYGDEATVQLFRFRDSGGRDVGLRFDLTVPLARFVAMHPELPMPFKRQHCALVWRAEKPGPGRYREFMQYDVDIVGTRAMTADAEIVQVMAATMSALGLDRFLIKVNNRKVLNGLGEWLKVDGETTVKVIRVIDKLDKIGWEGVSTELADEDKGPNLDEGQIHQVRKYLDAKRETSPQTLTALKELLTDSPVGQEGVAELTQIWDMIEAPGIADKILIDPTIARGLDYYTGPVFETTLLDCPEIGSVFSGGRFDNLVNMFSDRDVPGTGASVGVDRLIAAMQKLGFAKLVPYTAPVLILVQSQLLVPELVALSRELRSVGIANELYLGDAKLKKQFEYANKRGIPFVILLGETERQAGTVVLKQMLTGEQTAIPRAQLEKELKRKLAE